MKLPNSTPIYVAIVVTTFAWLGSAKSATAQNTVTDWNAIGITAARASAAPGSAAPAVSDLYSARRSLSRNVTKTQNLEALKQWAQLEDLHGSAGSTAYAALLDAMLRENAPRNELVAVCRRGLEVSLRTEHFDSARMFARKLEGLGDKTGLELLGERDKPTPDQVEVPGGIEALSFLTLGSAKTNPERFFLDYSQALNEQAVKRDKAHFIQEVEPIRGYFQQVSALAALGTRTSGGFDLALSLNDKAGRLRTEKVFKILGLKLSRSKEGLSVESAEGKSTAGKQDVFAALAIDDGAIQEALAAGKAYHLEIPVDHASIFPAEKVWKAAFYDRQSYPGGLAEAFLRDPRMPQICYALNVMDRGAAEALVRALPLYTLADHYALELSPFSAALAVDGERAEVPGGEAADGAWQQVTGVNPRDAAAFFHALLNRNNGKLLAFFYTLSHLDLSHQKFFTRSPQRLARFYELFHDSAETRHATDRQLGSMAFLGFLPEVPLDDSDSVDFPGGPEAWMVGDKKAKSKAKPDDEDEILIHLAQTEYKTGSGMRSDLEKFIAVARINAQRAKPIDAQRAKPLDAASAILLSQNYPSYAGFYAYFASLTALETSDYQSLFSVAAKLERVGPLVANVRLGQLHSFLKFLCIAQQTGAIREEAGLQLYRKAMDRYSNAQEATEWVLASLENIDDLINCAFPTRPSSRDAALKSLLLSGPGRFVVELPDHSLDFDLAAQRANAYDRILELQKTPSLDALFAIRDAAFKAGTGNRAADVIQRQLESFETLTPPKSWQHDNLAFKSLEGYQTAQASKILARFRGRLAKEDANPAEIWRLSAELLGKLEPWTELGMVGKIYARYLDPSDLIASEDPMLLRKHEFVDLSVVSGKRERFAPAMFFPSGPPEGSYFRGGLAEFSVAAGEARAEGNHMGGAIGAALLASIRGTEWHDFSADELTAFAARVRVAREWIVQSASSVTVRRELERQSLGILSLTRRAKLSNAIKNLDWPRVWECVTISDLYFLGDALIAHAPAGLWTNSYLAAMKEAAPSKAPDVLGQVAPHLSGCAEPRLRRYEPYEEYRRYSRPERIAERVAELKLYLAWQVDSLAWPPEAIPALASPAADAVVKKLQTMDLRDWHAAIEAYGSLDEVALESLLSKQ